MSEVVSVPGIAVAGDRLLAVVTRLNGRRYRLIVDTGATHIALLPEIINRDLGLIPLSDSIDQVAVGHADVIQVPLYRIDQVIVGGLLLDNLEVISLEWPRRLGVDGILGMNFLDAFPRICLDLSGLTLELHVDE